MLYFIHAHIYPKVLAQPVGRAANTPAQEWLVKCALLFEDTSHDDPNDAFYSTWTFYLIPQPHYTAPFAPHSTTTLTTTPPTAAETHTFPGLHNALHTLPNNPEAQHHLLLTYWRLAATASALWEHM